MIIFTYLNKLIKNLSESSIPNEGKLSFPLFIFSIILFLSYINTNIK